jgi:hypothetical protein
MGEAHTPDVGQKRGVQRVRNFVLCEIQLPSERDSEEARPLRMSRRESVAHVGHNGQTR